MSVPSGSGGHDFFTRWESMQPSWAWSTTSGTESKKEDTSFRLPIDHRIEENLDREGLEQASLEKEIPSSNIGFKLLQKMGWKHGKGLGKSQQGIVDPIRSGVNDFRLGLGKQAQDDYYTAEENIQRKKLEIEIEETEEIAQKREAVAQRIEKIEAEVKEIRKVFYCELCNKQYKLASEMEVHLSSYDHNHKKRFKESIRGLTDKEKEERQRREQLREQKELQKELQKRAQLATAVPASQPISAAAETAAATPVATPLSTATAIPTTGEASRGALRFGFGVKVKAGAAKLGKGSKALGKGKAAPVASIFGGADDDEDEAS